MVRGISELERIQRAIRMVRTDNALEVRVSLDRPLPLGLRIHSGERDSLLRRLMKRSDGTVLRHGRLCVFTHDQRHKAAKLLATLHFRLERIAHKPISQRQVERLLDISANERLRWSKDGRLRRSGTAQILRGAKIMLYTYPPREVERLLGAPEIIASWRDADRHNL